MKKNLHQRGAQAPLVGFKAGSQIKVKVEKLAIGGAGVARHEGLVVFIPQAAPNEELLVELTLVKKNFSEARILEILSPSPFRRTPPCPVANVCGGCNWQHIDEAEQLRQKELLVLETIKKFNRDLEFEYLPIQKSPRSLRYRNRIQPKYANDNFGFFARNSHAIVPITDCPITETTLTDRFAEVKKWIRDQKKPGLQKLEMYISEDNEVRYGLISDDDDGIGFSQVNRFQNVDLIQTVLDWTRGDDYPHIWDFYSGAGNFTFPLAEAWTSASVTGVELNPKLVERGRAKSRDSRIEFIKSDVESFLLKTKPKPQDLVILDPPRAGASEPIMRALLEARARKIIYISCHPVSLARDLQWFFAHAQKMGIKAQLTRVQAFEMFPQTDHVETVVELRVDS